MKDYNAVLSALKEEIITEIKDLVKEQGFTILTKPLCLHIEDEYVIKSFDYDKVKIAHPYFSDYTLMYEKMEIQDLINIVKLMSH